MLLWFAFALMTATVVAALVRPLARTGISTAGAAAAADVAVYQDQLKEIDADLVRGILQPAEAELARREVARRLLARADGTPVAAPVPPLTLRNAMFGLAATLPLAALGSYLLLGSPMLPGMPYVAKPNLAAPGTPLGELISQVETRLQKNPDDGQGWDVIGPVYFRLERFADAANAFARAGELLGPSDVRLGGFAEATVMANNGIVTEAARRAYEQLSVLLPDRFEPKFWLALAKEQDGQLAEAAREYRAMLASAPAGATWRSLVEERLAAVEKRPGSASAPGVVKPTAPSAASVPPAATAPAAANPRGPTAADVKAADALSDGDRGLMIRGMVDSLAKRLEGNPADVQGWLRLVQSYAVLGERDKAVAALGTARSKLAGNTAALSELAALAKTLGFGS
jgi:cytochrome c-type biogenesis protein CcmH